MDGEGVPGYAQAGFEVVGEAGRVVVVESGEENAFGSMPDCSAQAFTVAIR